MIANEQVIDILYNQIETPIWPCTVKGEKISSILINEEEQVNIGDYYDPNLRFYKKRKLFPVLDDLTSTTAIINQQNIQQAIDATVLEWLAQII